MQSNQQRLCTVHGTPNLLPLVSSKMVHKAAGNVNFRYENLKTMRFNEAVTGRHKNIPFTRHFDARQTLQAVVYYFDSDAPQSHF